MSSRDVRPRYTPPNAPLVAPSAAAPPNIFEPFWNCEMTPRRTGPAEKGAVPAHSCPDAALIAVIDRNESTAKTLERRMVGGVEWVVSNRPMLPACVGARNPKNCDRPGKEGSDRNQPPIVRSA